jgi:hypothetical protein
MAKFPGADPVNSPTSVKTTYIGENNLESLYYFVSPTWLYLFYKKIQVGDTFFSSKFPDSDFRPFPDPQNDGGQKTNAPFIYMEFTLYSPSNLGGQRGHFKNVLSYIFFFTSPFLHLYFTLFTK